jgi:hypothetical protein
MVRLDALGQTGETKRSSPLNGLAPLEGGPGLSHGSCHDTATERWYCGGVVQAEESQMADVDDLFGAGGARAARPSVGTVAAGGAAGAKRVGWS